MRMNALPEALVDGNGRQNEAGNENQYSPIAKIAKNSLDHTIRGLYVDKRLRFQFTDRNGKKSNVLDFKLKDNSGIIQLCAFDGFFDKFFDLIEVLTF